MAKRKVDELWENASSEDARAHAKTRDRKAPAATICRAGAVEHALYNVCFKREGRINDNMRKSLKHGAQPAKTRGMPTRSAV